MVRRTKAQALQTRSALLDAAEHLFLQQGVSRTSLSDIAHAAGTTRGAIYWHFKDKADLFNAMMERITLPLEAALAQASATEGKDPLDSVCAEIQNALHQTVNDEQTRRVFQIATQKVEYVDELLAISERRIAVISGLVEMTERAMVASAQQRGHILPLPSQTAALGLHMLIDGLLQNWLLNPQAFDLESAGRATLQTYLRGLGLTP